MKNIVATLAKNVIVFLFLTFLTTAPTLADINPPEPAGQGNLSPNSGTKVQMKNEKIEFNILQPRTDTSSSYPKGILPVKVTAEFNMYNTSDSTESMDITFPKCDDYSSPYTECSWGAKFSNFIVYVDSNLLGTVDETEIKIPKYQLGYCPEEPRAEVISKVFKWHQDFPAKKITNVKVTYNLDIEEYTPTHGYYLDYVLSTGGNWFGNIENGKIIFSSPDKVTDEYFKLDSGGNRPGFGDAAILSPNIQETIQENKMLINFDNLKPSTKENLHLFVVDPKERAVIDSLKDNVSKNGTFIAYANLGEEYGKLSTIHGYYENSEYATNSLNNFNKSIELANNFDDLKQITNKMIFTKNGGDQTEANQLTEGQPGGNSPFIGRGGNWVDQAMGRQSVTNAFQNLANKRLSFNKTDQFALNLLEKIKKSSPYPDYTTPPYSPSPCASPGQTTVTQTPPENKSNNLKILGLSVDKKMLVAAAAIGTLGVVIAGAAILYYFRRKRKIKEQLNAVPSLEENDKEANETEGDSQNPTA